MNKKGFTLTELLGIIAILAIIITITVSSYAGIQNNILEKQYENTKKYILTGAIDYAHKNGFTPKGKYIYISVKALIARGIISADDESGKIINPIDHSDMTNKCIKITYKSEDRSYSAEIEESNPKCNDNKVPVIE